jgi:histidine triad (HIT) family protein
MDTSSCIFCKIAAGQIPADTVHACPNFVAIRDISPQAPVHVIIIPRDHYETIMDLTDGDKLAGLMLFVQETARQLAIDSEGFRTVINCRDNGGQTVPHLHVHLLGGRFMSWPPG